MKYLFTLLFLVPVSVFAQSNSNSITNELEDLNRHIFSEYVLNKNTEPLKKHTSEDFILIAAPGMLENKQQVIDGVKNLNITNLNVTVDTTIVHDNVGIVIGVLEMTGTIMGRPVPGKIRYSSTFIKADDTWQLITRTMTAIRM